MCCRGVPARSCTLAWRYSVQRMVSAVVVRLNDVILNKIVRYQVCKLSWHLLSVRHRKGALYKICYRLCNGQIEAVRVDLAPGSLEGSVLLLSCQCFVG